MAASIFFLSSPVLAAPTFQEVITLGSVVGRGMEIRDSSVYIVGNSPPAGALLTVWNTISREITYETVWGTSSSDYYFDVTANTAGVFPAGGNYSFSTDGVGGKEYKSAIAKFVPPGQDPAWESYPNIQSYTGYESFHAVTVSDNDIYAVGYAQANGSNRLCTLLKYDYSGNLLWTQFFSGTGYYISQGEGVAWGNGSIYASGFDGEGSDKTVLARYLPNGTQVWKVTHQPEGRPARGYGVATDDAGNAYQVGYSISADDDLDILILKYDTYGNKIWEQEWGGPGAEMGRRIAYRNNRIFLVGYTDSFGSGGNDVVLLELDPTDGTVLSETFWGDDSGDGANDLAVTDTEIYIVGSSSSLGGAVLLRYEYEASPAILEHDFQVPRMTETQAYHIVTMPYAPTNPGPAHILGPSIDPYNDGYIRVGRWNPACSEYDEYPDMADFFVGYAFWAVSRYGQTLTFSGTEPTTETAPITSLSSVKIPLKNGWNQIGNPYLVSVSLANAVVMEEDETAELFSNGTITQGIFWTYVGEYEAAVLLEAGQGGWVKKITPGDGWLFVADGVWRSIGVHPHEVRASDERPPSPPGFMPSGTQKNQTYENGAGCFISTMD